MRIVVMGAGGVGGYFGARLALAGYEVSFVARGRHLSAIRRHGLRVESPLGDLHVAKPVATDDPKTLAPADLVLLSVKLWDTEAAARAIAPLIGPETAVVSFQNGVQKDDVLRRFLGFHAVLGGVCYIAATIAEPGVIRHTGKMQRLVVGEYDQPGSGRAAAFVEACRKAGIDADVHRDIRRTIWEKFVFLVGLSGTTATIRQPIGAIRSHPQTRAFLLDAMREVVAVGRAQDVQLADDFAQDRLQFCDGLPAEMTSSMHLDLERGNRLEVAWLSGDVVARGKDAAIATPVNRAIHDVLALYADGQPVRQGT
jgi:2-dehydropantoate 2-reductase